MKTSALCELLIYECQETPTSSMVKSSHITLALCTSSYSKHIAIVIIFTVMSCFYDHLGIKSYEYMSVGNRINTFLVSKYFYRVGNSTKWKDIYFTL